MPLHPRGRLALPVVLALLAFLLAACAETSQFVDNVSRSVQNSLNGTPDTIIGTVEVVSPSVGYLTCFQGSPGGALSRTPITSPTQAQGFPSVIVTKAGVMTTGNCAELQQKGLLVTAVGPGMVAVSGGKLDPKTPCSAVPKEQQAQYPKCVAFDASDPCSALPVDGTWRSGQSTLAASCDARKVNRTIEQVNAAKPGTSTTATAAPAKATVPVFTYKDAEGNTVSNAPDNCRIIHVTDANGNFVKKRYLSRQEDFVLASKCETALHDRISKSVKPQ